MEALRAVPRALAIDGGEPVRRKPWPTYDKGAVFVDEADEEAAIRAVRSRLYFRYDVRSFADTEVGRFEARLRKTFDVPYALAVSSGTAAIALGLLAAGVPPGSEVACQGFTFAATPSAILLAGCKPVLIEVDDNLHLDIDDLERKLNPRMKAVVVVHMRGFAADMGRLMAVAERAGVPVIEDAVPVLGAELGGRKLGTFGLAGAFSTQSDKSINTGEGGFLVTRDPELFGRAVILSGAYEGRYRGHFEHEAAPPEVDDLALPLYNFRMDEIRAALAASSLDRLPRRLAVLDENYRYVVSRLEGLGGIAIRRPVEAKALLGESLIFRLPGDGGSRAAWVTEALRAEGIDARHLGSPADTNVRCFWNWRLLFGGESPEAIRVRLPRTARRLAQAVDVPLSPTLTRDDCDDLVSALHKVLGALA